MANDDAGQQKVNRSYGFKTPRDDADTHLRINWASAAVQAEHRQRLNVKPPPRVHNCEVTYSGKPPHGTFIAMRERDLYLIITCTMIVGFILGMVAGINLP